MNKKEDKFVSLEESRKLPFFKLLHPYKRKSIINIGKEFPETLFYINHYKEIYFKNKYIASKAIVELFEIITVEQDERLTNLLNKISQYGNCISSNVEDDICKLYKFTFQESKRKPEFIYHQTDTKPEIILKEGIKTNYSLGIKAFPPLVFVGTEPCWYGKYIYKIKTDKKLFIDTNMDWRKLDKRPYLCLKDNIEPEEVVSYEVQR